MNVLFVLSSTDHSGPVLQALDVCRNSRRFGIRTSVAALGGGDLEREFEDSAASFYRLDLESNPDLNAAFKLRKIISTEKVEIVHVFGAVEAVHAYLATLRLKTVKTVMTFHSVPTGKEVPSLPVGSLFAARRMDAGIVPRKSLFPELRKAAFDTKSNFFLVPYGLDPDRIAKSVVDLKELSGVGAKGLLMGMSADFEWNGPADHLTVCRALPEVLRKYPKARFIFSGNVRPGGEDIFDECIELCDESGIGDKVFFTADRPEIRSIAGSVDVFVYSAKGGSIDLDVIDAMLAGVPLVVSDLEPLIEVTNGGRCAGVFVRGDSDELSDVMVTLLKNKRIREKRAADAMKYAKANHSIDIHIGLMKTFYRDLAVPDVSGKIGSGALKAAKKGASDSLEETGSEAG